MASQPTPAANQRRLWTASRPNFNDFNGPPDGDYVRYVDNLMAWSQQEQERQRLKALGEKQGVARASTPDNQWGRAPSQPVVAVSTAQSGSVDSAVERFKRKAQLQAARLQQQAATASSTAAPSSGRRAGVPPAKLSASWMLVVAGLIAVSIFATEWLPVAIIGWVAWNVYRTVRAASGAGKS